MTLNDFTTVLTATGFPVTYDSWPEGTAPSLPFLCFRATSEEPLLADASVYCRYSNVRVELYTAQKDPSSEAKVELALAGFHWKKSEIYISTERCFMILYEIEV